MTNYPPQSDESQSAGELRRALAEAQAEATLNRDRFLRSRADMENFKKRVERQAADQSAAAKRGLLLKVLGVMDNLDRALQYQTDEAAGRDSLLTGLRLTSWQFNQLLLQEGLQPIPAVGQPFDPRLHEAVDTITTAEQPDGTVLQENLKGYRLGDDVLRPARVVVAAAPQHDTQRAER
ncbi:MAG TPA: nucleotide exchange factor GrpE [Chloroflexota bacterium]